jgi:hypothetical protein
MVVFRMSLLVVMLVEHAWAVDQKVVESLRDTKNTIEAELGADGEHTLVGCFGLGLFSTKSDQDVIFRKQEIGGGHLGSCSGSATVLVQHLRNNWALGGGTGKSVD